MKAKKMTQKLTLLTFTALFIAFMFNACSDVAGPNENLGNEYSQLSSVETETEDIRSRSRRSTVGGQSTTIPSTCTLDNQIISYGGNGEPLTDRIESGQAFGVVVIELDNGELKVKAKIDPAQQQPGLDDNEDPKDWLIYKLELYIAKENVNTRGQRDRVINDSFDPTVETITYTYTLSDKGINSGDSFEAAVHVDITGGENNQEEGESAWAGDNPNHANSMNFVITNQCPPITSGSFNSAG